MERRRLFSFVNQEAQEGSRKGAPGVKLFLNVPGPRGSQLKINVYFQHFTKKEKKIHSLLVPNLVLVVSVRTVSWFR